MHREHHEPLTASRAKRLRRDLTPSELTLWAQLRTKQLGHRFRRQEPIGIYIVDFVCLARRLIIEIDGEHHPGSLDDEVRDAELGRRGFRILRFTNEDVAFGLHGVVEVITEALET